MIYEMVRHEQRLIGLKNHETGLPGGGHWQSSAPAAWQVLAPTICSRIGWLHLIGMTGLFLVGTSGPFCAGLRGFFGRNKQKVPQHHF